MDRTLIWTERASADIETIVRYILRRNPAAATSIGMGIFDRAQILLSQPEAGSILNELREGGWRKLIFRRWKIIYRIEGDVIGAFMNNSNVIIAAHARFRRRSLS